MSETQTAIEKLVEAIEARDARETAGKHGIAERATIISLLQKPPLLAELKQAMADTELRRMVEHSQFYRLEQHVDCGYTATAYNGRSAHESRAASPDAALKAALDAAGGASK